MAIPSFAQLLPEWSSKIYTNHVHYFNDKPQIKLNRDGDLILIANSNRLNEDFIIVKYSPTGNILWQVVYDDTLGRSVVEDFQLDNNDNIFIIGRCPTDSGSDGILLKYKKDGTQLWKNQYNSSVNRNDGYNAMIFGTNNNYYVTGYSAIDTLQRSQMLISKIDSTGNTIWNTYYGSDTTVRYIGRSISIFNNKLRAVCRIEYEPGYPILEIDLNGSILNVRHDVSLIRPANCFYNDGNGNTYVGFGMVEGYKLVKFDTVGLLDWQDSVGTNLSPGVGGDELLAITGDSLGYIYTTGRYYGAGFMSILTVKYSPQGQRVWIRKYESPVQSGFHAGTNITVDKYDNIYVCGYGGSSSNTYDYTVVKYDNDGNLIGDIRYNNPSNTNDAITSFAIGGNGDIYVTGLTFDTIRSYTTTQKYKNVNPVGITKGNRDLIITEIAPNPFSTQTQISFPNPQNDLYNFTLANILGEILISLATRGSVINIHGADIVPGYYTYSLESEENVSSGMLVRIE